MAGLAFLGVEVPIISDDLALLISTRGGRLEVVGFSDGCRNWLREQAETRSAIKG